MADGTHIYRPPLGFHFGVSFLPKVLKENESKDEKPAIQEPAIQEWSFQSVSGLTKEVVTESFREGGQEHDYALPVKTQYPDLVLKRGIWAPVIRESKPEEWQAWFFGMMKDFKINARDLKISLLSPTGVVLMAWNIKRAWPKKWTIADFNAEENQVVIETMELRYDSFEITSPKLSQDLPANPPA